MPHRGNFSGDTERGSTYLVLSQIGTLHCGEKKRVFNRKGICASILSLLSPRRSHVFL